MHLFRKRLVLISEAPRGYFGSASWLSPKRLVVILEAPSGSEARRMRRVQNLSGLQEEYPREVVKLTT